ncbi:hypothetical protein F4V57_07435 [Acinetobacter qingfengensis]|uniref:DUF3137 domain-containing protein n=1 Tax=Acinetobacter qingfengensis TaxID=1262585 RepID=A0A1E7R2R3_9GAMM|nr:hypothetical protein [Acinetobacter qingfengensis]KAA8733874.1 hypothetical protein F4V57_07435 [Acinetobacter qingfengensis]OEY93614.1 hypothetical protein BJI46_04000 [Acinetobacter qingfengensis]
MPIENLQEHWRLHRRMNKKVWNNVERLRRIALNATSKQDILDALHPWRLSPLLTFNNTWSYILLALSVVLTGAATFYFYQTGLWLLFLWIIGFTAGCYAYLSIEQPEYIERVIQMLAHKTLQFQYDFKFNEFPPLGVDLNNPSYLLTLIKNQFDCFQQGRSDNEIIDFAGTTWQVNEDLYPVLLVHYIAITEVTLSDKNGNEYTKQIETQRWGACVFNMPNLAVVISNKNQNFPSYPVEWDSSDIGFNQQFYLAGQSEYELAKSLTPQRILALAEHLQDMRGCLMFHHQLNIMCYLSEQNIFKIKPPKKAITDISQLRGFLRTLQAPHYECMQKNLVALIPYFQNKNLLDKSKDDKVIPLQ